MSSTGSIVYYPLVCLVVRKSLVILKHFCEGSTFSGLPQPRPYLYVHGSTGPLRESLLAEYFADMIILSGIGGER